MECEVGMNKDRNDRVGKKRNRKGGTRRSGNTLFLIVALAFMIVAAALIGIALFMAMSEQRRNESKLDSYALNMVNGINGQDWVGELNKLTGYSRELVFTSREVYDTSSSDFAQLKPLASQLLDESRYAVKIINEEKQTVLQHTAAIVKANISIANREMKTSRGLKLPWVSTEAAQIQSVDIGYLEGVMSNVSAPGANAIPGLRKYDSDQKYFEEKSNLYYGNINATLPAPDDDLKFEIASLPAAVKDTVSPARLASADEFRTLLTIEPNKLPDFSRVKALPSAVHVSALMKMASKAGEKDVESPVQVSATAACPGGTMRLP
jgi:hypothetical protein